jgi:hypothetical protein
MWPAEFPYGTRFARDSGLPCISVRKPSTLKPRSPNTPNFTSLFTVREARARYGKDIHCRSFLNLHHRLKAQGRLVANSVYPGTIAA